MNNIKLFSITACFLVITALFMTTPVYAAECGNQETSIITCANDSNGIWSILLIVINILAAGVGVVAVGGIVYGALRYTTAGDDSQQVNEAITTIRNTVIGIIAFAVMFASLQFLIPGGFMNSLLNPPDAAPKNESFTISGSSDDENDKSSSSDRISHLHSSGRFDRSTSLWKSDINKLSDQYSADIITATEASGRSEAVSRDGWAHTNGESIVAWDTSKWKRINSELIELAPGTPYIRKIVMSIAILEHKDTKTKWLWTSSHIPSSVDAGRGNFTNESMRVNKWKASMRDMSSIVNNQLTKHGIKPQHSVITADWNVNLAQSEWRNSIKAYFPNRNPSNPVGSAGTHGNRTIDTSLVHNDLTVTSWKGLGPIQSSDHKPFVAKYKIDTK